MGVNGRSGEECYRQEEQAYVKAQRVGQGKSLVHWISGEIQYDWSMGSDSN